MLYVDSNGSFVTLHFGIRYPEMALSLMVAGTGYGALSENHEHSNEKRGSGRIFSKKKGLVRMAAIMRAALPA